MPRSAELTPMLRHYSEVKAEHPDAVVLYRMGDFYEVFFDDAATVAPVLEVALTARHKGKPSETAMCGVPHHALEAYLGKLLRAGFKVAICDQVEDPRQAKGLVKREVTRVVTPGTVSDPELLDGKEENLLAAIAWQDEAGAGALLDVSTGRFSVRRWRDVEEALQDLALERPREVVLPAAGVPDELRRWADSEVACVTIAERDRWFDPRRAAEVLQRHFGTATLAGFGLEGDGAAPAQAAATALSYAKETQKSELPHVASLRLAARGETMQLDATTLANLEVFRSLADGSRRGTLLAVLDRTRTPAGGRLLRGWLRAPLVRREAIERRHDAVEELLGDGERLKRLGLALTRVGDPARLLTRAVLGTLTPREAAVLRVTLAVAPELLADLAGARGSLLAVIAAADPLADVLAELERVLAAEPPAARGRPGVIADGVDPELDHCRSLARDSKKHLLELERREREATGIGSLKVRYNKVFGYYLEVTKANQALVPERYERKQTLVNAERYVTPELKELELAVLGAEERQLELEERHFEALRATLVGAAGRLGELARRLAELDAVASLAVVAAEYDYVRPRIGEAGTRLEIVDGRHPVVERLGGEPFVPNDARLSAAAGDLVVLTGPNMGGKSTYLRQVALIVLLAQAGSFVPAAEARVGIVDRIFTRVGASDDLSRGASTFMVEMVETARILHQATPASLVILDEVGRGTATFDGLSLAWAVVEHLHEAVRAKALFATHFHELTELAAVLPRVVNLTMAVKEWENRIVFLKRVVPGSADKSYGLHVARLAGIPPQVVERAAAVLANLEAGEYDLSGRPRLARGAAPGAGEIDQLQLFAPPEEVIASVLRGVDVERLSPLAALNLLQTLKTRLG